MPLRCKVFARLNNFVNCDEADVSFVQTQKKRNVSIIAVQPSKCLLHMWCIPTKQETGRIGLFWDMGNWSWHRVKNNSSVNFEIFVLFFYHLHVISDWFWTFSHKKILLFLQHVKSKMIGIGNLISWLLKITLSEKALILLYTKQMIISKSRRGVNLILMSN